MSRNPYSDALRLTKQVFDSRNDVKPDEMWKLINDALNTGCLRYSSLGFVERYDRNQISLHIHCSGRNGDAESSRIGHRSDGWEFCAVLQHDVSVADVESAKCAPAIANINAGNSGVQIAVLVDIRKLQKKPEEGVGSILRSTIRLQTLDECIGVAGDPMFSPALEILKWQRHVEGGDSATRRVVTKGEVTTPFPILLGGNAVPFDEFEKQMTQGGSTVVENLSREDSDIGGRLLADLQFLIAIRLGDHGARLISTVVGNGLSESLALFCHYPDRLALGGIDAIHEQA